ncbi:helix-turn-helix domain-containing protein [Bacillus solitudinis]|uniref:helix-turn-helix domain-containing protein n=1 Tax=Bacillus solitudinis TaxID=2014074 RepID=UPI000C23F2DD|nr:helix-turn-helix domain-containing protein [Bacillus solitudinis]
MIKFFRKWLKFTLVKTETRLVLFLTIAVFFIILGVSITSYHTSKSVLQEQVSEPQQQMLQISMDFIDDYINESDNIAIKIALNSNVYQFLTSDVQNSYNNITAIYQLLSTLINNSPYIKSIYIYDLQHDSFVSMPQGYSSSKTTFIDSEWIDVADEFGDEMMLIKKRVIPEGAKYRGSEITLFRKIMIQGEFKGIVAMNLVHEELFSPIDSSKISNLNSMRFILDQNNEFLYSTSNRYFEPESIERAIAELNEKNLGDITYQDKKLLASQVLSPLTGWKYVSIVSQESLLEKSKRVGNVVFFVSVLALLIGGMTIFYINMVAFRPIRRMKQLFKMGEQDKSRQDLVHLEGLAVELLMDYAKLNQVIRKVKTEASSKFFHDIYHENITDQEEICEKWSGYFRELSNKPLIVAMISIDHFYDWSISNPKSDHSLLKFALANIISEILAEYSHNECVDLGKDKLAIVLHPGEDISKLMSTFEEALSTVQKVLKFSVSIGISKQKTDIRKLREAIVEADTALSNRLYKGYGSLLNIEDFTEKPIRNISVKDPILDQLTEAIDTGDKELSQKLIDYIISEIQESHCENKLAFTILRRVGESIHQISEESKKDEEMVFFEHLHTIHLHDIAEVLKQQTNKQIEALKISKKGKDSILSQHMIDYMKKHLDEPIGIAEIVDSIGISVSLASSLFKKEKNETIYGYFTNLRMEHAAELLLNTNEKISDIASRVGYQHENSFIRAFRKYKNITPGKYRDVLKKRKDIM